MVRDMGIEAAGKLHLIFETKQVSERFTKREFVVEMADSPKYPQMVLFQLTGDRCSQLDGMSVGDDVRIEFSLRGREWKSPSGEVKYFNSLDVWKIEPMNASRGQSQNRGGGGGGQSQSRSRPSVDPRGDDGPPRRDDEQPRGDDDLPF
jgi:single-stranded DNA-binding protein